MWGGEQRAIPLEECTSPPTEMTTHLRAPSALLLLPPPQLASSSSASPRLIQFPLRRTSAHRLRSRFAVAASLNSNFLRVIQTTWNVAKSGIEAGANLVPTSIPRPLARLGVTGVAVMVALVLLKSFLSTLFFALAVMALIYFTFITLNADEAPRPRGDGGSYSSDEDALEEARRIMDKYK